MLEKISNNLIWIVFALILAWVGYGIYLGATGQLEDPYDLSNLNLEDKCEIVERIDNATMIMRCD